MGLYSVGLYVVYSCIVYSVYCVLWCVEYSGVGVWLGIGGCVILEQCHYM